MAKSIRGMKPYAPAPAPVTADLFSEEASRDAQDLDALEQPTLTRESAKKIDGVKQTTGIEWTNHTWNPMVGCTIHTAGCTNCYAMKQAGMIQAKHYEGVVKFVKSKLGGLDSVWTGKLNVAPPHIMNKPDTIKGEAMIFVNSMSDFFHADMLLAWQTQAMEVMKRNGRHTFQILTKRPENIWNFLTGIAPFGGWTFPKNVWIGATMEREDYRWRIDHLRKLREEGIAARTFLSIEPLIGSAGDMNLAGIDWVIIGGESGPGARFMDPMWVRDVVNQCLAQNVPVFLKQYGVPENNPIYIKAIAEGASKTEARAAVNKLDPVGKGGSLLDGVAYKQFPTKAM